MAPQALEQDSPRNYLSAVLHLIVSIQQEKRPEGNPQGRLPIGDLRLARLPNRGHGALPMPGPTCQGPGEPSLHVGEGTRQASAPSPAQVSGAGMAGLARLPDPAVLGPTGDSSSSVSVS